MFLVYETKFAVGKWKEVVVKCIILCQYWSFIGGNLTLWGNSTKRRLDQTLLVRCGDDLTGALHVLQLQLSPPLPSSLNAINPANRALAGKWAFKRRKSEK